MTKGYIKGQVDILEMLIEATEKVKGNNQFFVSTDELLAVYNDWLKKVREKYE